MPHARCRRTLKLFDGCAALPKHPPSTRPLAALLPALSATGWRKPNYRRSVCRPRPRRASWAKQNPDPEAWVFYVRYAFVLTADRGRRPPTAIQQYVRRSEPDQSHSSTRQGTNPGGRPPTPLSLPSPSLSLSLSLPPPSSLKSLPPPSSLKSNHIFFIPALYFPSWLTCCHTLQLCIFGTLLQLHTALSFAAMMSLLASKPVGIMPYMPTSQALCCMGEASSVSQHSMPISLAKGSKFRF